MIKPLSDRVLVEPNEADEKSSGGIYIPDAAQEKPAEGVIIGVGSGVESDVSEGEVVMYGKYAGTEVEHEGVKYLIIRESDLMAVVIP